VAEHSRRGTGAAYDFEPAADAAPDRPRGGGTAVATRPASRGFGRIGRFVREVVAELRKVIWPTQKELVTYAVVVIVFIAVMMTIIAGYDVVFSWLVRLVLGN
jgi:preprotein translocase subunit SecE